MAAQSPRRSAHRGRLLLLLLLLAGLGWAWLQRWALYDWWRLHNYQAPAAISQLATDDTMTPSARHIFYVNRPLLQSDKSSFGGHCLQTEQTIVLGCYLSPQQGIYIFAVDDVRLQGVEQVTAAHEMLHAAYDRLSSSARQELNAELQDYFAHGLQDERIKAVIATYQKTEPKDVVDEMHSVFGTEIAQLPPALEQHYRQYFVNRQQVAAFAAKYQGEFQSRKAAVQTYDAQLTTLKQQIDSLQVDLEQKRQQITTQRSQLQATRASGDNAAYNAGVAPFNALVANYNAEVAQVQALVKQYNDIVTKRNALVTEEQQLTQALDSRAATVPAQ